jgi:hypothetical protein
MRNVVVTREGEEWFISDGTRVGSPSEAIDHLRAHAGHEEFPLLVTVVDGPETYHLEIPEEGSPRQVDGELDGNDHSAGWIALPRRWWILAVALLVLIVGAALLVPLFNGPAAGTSHAKDGATASAAPSATPGSVQWTIPDGKKLVGSTNDLIVTYQGGKLSLRDALTGTEQKFGPFDVQGEPVRAVGPDLIAVQLGNDKVLVVGSYNSRNIVDGVIQGRGTRPVIVSKDQRKYLSLSDADNGIKVLAPVPSGETVLGAIPQGVVFATTDSVRVGDTKPVKMTAPTTDAKVTAWIAVTNETVTAVWGNTVVIHDLRTGAILDQTPESDQKTTFDQGVVVSNGKTVSGKTFVNLCDGYAVISGQVWCPSPSGDWTSGSARLPEKPTAVGSSWWIDSKGNVRTLVKGSGQ